MSVKLMPHRTPARADERKTRPAGQVLALAGAATMVLAALLPWVTVRGQLPLDLGVLGAEVTAGGRTVTGAETAAFAYLLGLAGVIAVLALVGRARRALLTLGPLTLVGGGVLLYYLANVVDIETSDRTAIERAAADLALTSTTGPGPYLLLFAGALLTVGGLVSRRHH